MAVFDGARRDARAGKTRGADRNRDGAGHAETQCRGQTRARSRSDLLPEDAGVPE
jgi:hypothetical protein